MTFIKDFWINPFPSEWMEFPELPDVTPVLPKLEKDPGRMRKRPEIPGII